MSGAIEYDASHTIVYKDDARASGCRHRENQLRFGTEGQFLCASRRSFAYCGFGLMANSAAVIIGAMLVSPLMTLIFGTSLSLVRGDPNLMERALRAVVLGIILAIGVAAILGSLPVGVEPAPEMLSRTKPTLFGLLVAVLATFAGTYAMIDERLSPALPGVAIATAIVPPLSNSGICLAWGAYKGALGSFVLFLANFFSILLVSSITFIVAGLIPVWHRKSTIGAIRRFGLPVIGFAIIAGVLTPNLKQLAAKELNWPIKLYVWFKARTQVQTGAILR
jgi:uncharacterized hydrophobic protein (TIGR00271 family)